MAIDDIRADIAFVKDLVDDGDAGRKRGGVWMTSAGLIYAATSIFLWWEVTQQRAFSGWWIAGTWFIASAIHYVVGIALTARLPRGRNASGRAIYSVGGAIAMNLSALFVAGIAASAVNHNYQIWALFPSIVLAAYGTFWLVTAAVTRESWRNLVAAGAYVSAALFTLVVARPEGLLAFAACLTLLATVPGVYMLNPKRA